MLGDKERTVLAASCLDADLSVDAIAEITSLKPHVVRRAIQSIESSGIVQKFTYIDVYPLGLFYLEVLLNFQPGYPHKLKIINYLESSPLVSYIEQTSGRFEYRLSVIARNPFEINSLFCEIGERFPQALAERRLLLTESLVDYSLRFLAPQLKGRRAVGFGNRRERIDLDELDHAVLQKLSRPGVRNVTDLARALGAKASTVQYRLDRLKQGGVIVGTRYFPNLFKLGYHLFDIHVQTKGLSQSIKDTVEVFADDEPSVYALLRCTGEWEFTMCVAVKSGEAIDEVTDRLSARLGQDLQRITTQTVVKHIKLCFYPLINPA
ncbi:MAG: winged helix-turn-helix transcriptional regulator [Pseudomonadota bacterium]|jgi:DNA-binding Lrp family transcriptional regulator